MKYLYIAIGGGFGSLSRYLLSTFVMWHSNKLFPYGTLIVNLTGCFLIGMLYAAFENTKISPDLRLFIFTGFLGGFTTFSSYGLETFNLIKETQYKYAFLNFIFNNLIGIFLVLAGYYLSRLIFKKY